MASYDNMTPQEIDIKKKENIAKVWKIAGLLALITAVEFAFAFLMPASLGRNIIFILLTFLKAFYIMAEFMHMKHEAKFLVNAIIYPLIFISWLVTALLYEGGAIAEGIANFTN